MVKWNAWNIVVVTIHGLSNLEIRIVGYIIIIKFVLM